MIDRTCTLPDCGRPFYARGWCNPHYQRWRKYGSTCLPPPKKCMIPRCGRPHKSLGYCNRHYLRFRVHGDPLGGGKERLAFPGNLLRRLRFMPPGRLSTGCIEFTGSKATGGYGQVKVDHHEVLTHRAAYEMARGPVAPGLQLHHRCENPACCNPGHLEPLTPSAHARLHAAAKADDA